MDSTTQTFKNCESIKDSFVRDCVRLANILDYPDQYAPSLEAILKNKMADVLNIMERICKNLDYYNFVGEQKIIVGINLCKQAKELLS